MKKKILLVDDEPFILEIVSLALGGCRKYELLVAGDGADGLKIARERSSDLVLLDVRMPILDGLETCHILKNDPATSSALVVLLTAKAQRMDVERGFAAGADDYILKPFSPTALLARVSELLNSTFSVGESSHTVDGTLTEAVGNTHSPSDMQRPTPPREVFGSGHRRRQQPRSSGVRSWPQAAYSPSRSFSTSSSRSRRS